MKAKVYAAQNADEITPQAAKALGMYPDRNHKQLQTVDANPQNSKANVILVETSAEV